MSERDFVMYRAAAHHGTLAGRHHWSGPLVVCTVGRTAVRLTFPNLDDAIDFRWAFLLGVWSEEGELTGAGFDRCRLTRHPLFSALGVGFRKIMRGLYWFFDS